MSRALDADVLIVGGGPIGLATAIAARRRGLDALVIDRRQPPLDKACGEGLMPDGVRALRALGVDVSRLGRPFSGIRYVDGPYDVEADFRHPGRGIRRTELTRALVEHAERCGVRLAWGETLRSLESDGAQTDRRRLRAAHVIGADGLRSTVRRLAGLEARQARRQRLGVRRHYELTPWSDRVEVHWADGCEAYVTPVGDRSVGLAILWDTRIRPTPPTLERFAGLRARFADARPISRRRGSGPFEQRVRAVRRGRVSLVGDAAGYLDAITGEGLAVGLHQARALADAIADGDPARYVAAHRRILARPTTMTRVLLALAARPRLRRRAIAALSRAPQTFERMLAVHAREAPPRQIGAVALARLAFDIARGDLRRAAHASQCVR